jgi:hypothetical protein
MVLLVITSGMTAMYMARNFDAAGSVNKRYKHWKCAKTATLGCFELFLVRCGASSKRGAERDGVDGNTE